VPKGNTMNKENKFINVLCGDLNQLARQRIILNSRGVETRQSDVFPCVMRKDVPEALKIIWEGSIEGWWHYEDLYLKYGICTEEEFKARMSK
jgi:hypothetical protein